MEYLLNAPLEDSKLKLKNRLVMPPMATAKADNMGLVSLPLLEYYNEKSQEAILALSLRNIPILPCRERQA